MKNDDAARRRIHEEFADAVRRRLRIQAFSRSLTRSIPFVSIVSIPPIVGGYVFTGALHLPVILPVCFGCAVLFSIVTAYRETPDRATALRYADRALDKHFLLPTAWDILTREREFTEDDPVSGYVVARSDAILRRVDAATVVSIPLPRTAYRVPLAFFVLTLAIITLPSLVTPRTIDSGSPFTTFVSIAEDVGQRLRGLPSRLGLAAGRTVLAENLDSIPIPGDLLRKSPEERVQSPPSARSDRDTPLDDTLRGLAPGEILHPRTVPPSAQEFDRDTALALRITPAPPDTVPPVARGPLFSDRGDGSSGRHSSPSAGDGGETGESDTSRDRTGEAPTESSEAFDRSRTGSDTAQRSELSADDIDRPFREGTQDPARGPDHPSTREDAGDTRERGNVEIPGSNGGNQPGDASLPPISPREARQRRAAAINELRLPQVTGVGPTDHFYTRMAPERSSALVPGAETSARYTADRSRDVTSTVVPAESREYVRDYFYRLSR